MTPLPETVRRLWRIEALLTAAVLLVVGAVVEVIVRNATDPPLPPALLPLTLAAVASGGGWALATLQYRAWGFEVTDEWVRANWGIVTRHTTVIPRNRVQTVTSRNGPIERRLGLTSVVIHTAGASTPNLAIPHLADDTVEWLRRELARGRSS